MITNTSTSFGSDLVVTNDHALLQRFDLVQGLPGLSARPVFQQFGRMGSAPFLDQSQCAGTQIAFQYCAIVDANGGLFAALFRVEMWRRMIVVVRGDDDTEESADFRQFRAPGNTLTIIISHSVQDT